MFTRFREIWVVDFEFHSPDGHNPWPICMVARELRSGRLIRLGRRELETLARAPFSTGPSALFIAYYASAEVGCFLALGWPVPANILDLYVEFRNITNGLPTHCGSGLLGALAYFGLDSIEAAEKKEMRDVAMRGGPFSDAEMADLLDYCQTDVDALAKLLPAMTPQIRLPHALLRGQFMAAAAYIERNGVPVDTPMLARLQDNWEGIQDRLITEIDSAFGVYEDRSFSERKFEDFCRKRRISWPYLESGRPALDHDTFSEMALIHPEAGPLRDLRHALGELRLNSLAVGPDGRNRTLLSAFRARTGRNQPSNAKFIFGPAVWLRGLIKPAPGMALAYLDFSQEEFAVAALLSGDERMQAAYLSGDPYMEFAIQAGLAPHGATKASHPNERDLAKQCLLAVQYMMGPDSLALRIRKSSAHAAELLRLHRQTYPRFWAWSDGVQDYASLNGKLFTTFGWTVHAGENPNPRSFRNFPMQANGAEILRLACVMGIEAGIKICAPVHDAVLIEAPIGEIEECVAKMQQFMADASAIVLGGFRLRVGLDKDGLILHPNRYMDRKRGKAMWDRVQALLPPSPRPEMARRGPCSVIAAV